MKEISVPTTKLNNGQEMPQIGFGVFQIPEDKTEQCVIDAIHTGYRLIDTAQHYNNETAVGRAIRHCGIPRDELFITTKIWFKSYETEDALASVHESMKKLDLEYLDLVLLHQPFGNYYAAWRALEKLQKDGLVRSIGVSNFEPDRLVDLCNFNDVVPQVDQLETHLFCQRHHDHEWLDKLGIRHEGWAPLAEGANNLFADPVLTEIGKQYGKTPAQVALRALVQMGVTPIPKSTHVERMQQNIDIFDFELSEDDM